MKELIEALQILLKYGNPDHPTHCEHDVMYICGIEPDRVSVEDKVKLANLGFHIEDDQFRSYRYGSS